MKTACLEIERPVRVRARYNRESRLIKAGKPREVRSTRRRRTRWPVTFPSRYIDTYIALIDVQPYWAYAHWEVDETELEHARNEISSPGEFVIRVYDVTWIHFNGSNAHSYFDIAVDKEVCNWYINLRSTSQSLMADIGLRALDGKFVAVARSNCVQVPRACEAADGEVRWMFVDGDPRKRHRVPCAVSVPFRRPDTGSPVRLDLCEVPDDVAMASISQGDVMEFYRELFAGAACLPQTTDGRTPAPGSELLVRNDSVLEDSFARLSEQKRCPAA